MQAKKDMQLWIDQMTLGNIEETLEQIRHYENFLSQMTYLQVPTMETTASENENEEVEFESVKEEIPKYRLERQLRGGFIKELNAYVPEGAIRSIGAEDGDYVYAKHKGSGHFYYELAEKGSPINTERKEVQFGIVEQSGDLFMVSRSLMNGGQNTKINGVLHTFLLSREDVLELKLEDGDVVDLAFYENKPSTVRVVWKHDTDEKGYQAPLKSGYYKDSNGTKEKFVDPLLENKNVLVLGLEPRKAEYKQAIEQHGGTFDWVEGTEGEERLERKIAKADVVIILIKYIRHHASQFTVKTCKEHQVAYSIVDTFGVQTVVDAAVTPQVQPASELEI